jgi:hypothetical protein
MNVVSEWPDVGGRLPTSGVKGHVEAPPLPRHEGEPCEVHAFVFEYGVENERRAMPAHLDVLEAARESEKVFEAAFVGVGGGGGHGLGGERRQAAFFM